MRRSLVLAFLVASLILPGATTTVAARPKCDGKLATIVGTNGKNVIIGTTGRDVIVAKGGNDTIRARGGRDRVCGGEGKDVIEGGNGNDRLFGGSGNDVIEGGGGDDRLFGFDGNDRIFGQAGNDSMDGGDGFDLCDQGPGSGFFSRCERADLAVDVESPANTSEEIITFAVEVTNNGPDDVPYVLRITVNSPGLDCGDYPFEGNNPQFVLAAGTSRSQDYVVNCDNPQGDEPSVTLSGLATGPYLDPDADNNFDESTTTAVVE